MKFEFELEEINAILAYLQESPTKMGFFPICQKIIQQGNAQVTPPPPTEAKPA